MRHPSVTEGIPVRSISLAMSMDLTGNDTEGEKWVEHWNSSLGKTGCKRPSG